MMEIRLWRKVIIARLAPGYKYYTWIGILLSTDLRVIGMINRFLRIASPQGSNKQTLMKYLCFIFCVLLVGACSSTKGSGKDTLFCELDKEIQDTLQSVSQKVLEEDYAPQAMIDFSGNCKFTERNIGPWVISIQIEDTVNKISVSLPTNAPMPYIVHKYTVYYPEEYNLLVMGFDKNTKFRTIRMK